MVCNYQHLIRSIGVSFLSLAVQSTILFAQLENYRVEPVPIATEQSESTVKCVLQDSEGFIWFGTNHGLFRYDGLEVKVFRHDPRDQTTISSDNIVGISEDRPNILWIATASGLDRYDKYKERFESIIDTVVITPIWEMLDDEKGNIWLGTYMSGIVKFEKKSKRVNYEFTLDPADTTRRIKMYELMMDKNGILWIRYNGAKISRYDPESGTYEDIQDTPCSGGSFLEDRSGRFWITSKCGLYLFDTETRTFERQLYQSWDLKRLNDDNICSIMEDKIGNLWFTTYDGVYKYSPELKLLYHWPNRNTYPSSVIPLSNNAFTYEDNAGTIWIFNRGTIFKLQKEQANFTVINTEPPLTDFGNICYLDSKDSMLVEAEGGYYAYNRKKGTIRKYNLSNPLCMYKDTYGLLWIGTENGLYRRVQSDDHTIEHIAYRHIPGDSSSLPGNYVYNIFEDSSGKLWIGCQFAMPCYYDRENNCFMHLVDNKGIFSRIHKPYMFHETSNKNLIATAQGAYKIIPPFMQVSEHAVSASEVIEIIPVKPFRTQVAEVYVSFQDSRGTIWFGSQGMGLFKWEDDSLPGKTSKGKWNLYNTKDGLPGNNIMRIEEDLHRNLWIGTTTGLSRFDPISETFTNFYKQNGLPSSVFLKYGATSPNGELFFGTISGLISFHPDSIELNKRIPPVRITSFRIHNQEVIPGEKSILNRSIQYTDHVKLSHNLNTISIGFAVLNYNEPERNQHKYIMEGLDEDWVFSGKRNNVTYANLRPGNYTFRATGSNNDGVWNEEGVALSIRVMAPPWFTWWAYIIYGFILTGIIFSYRRYLLNHARLQTDLEVERMEKEKVMELDQMKSRFFANISHELRTPLTLILAPVRDILQKRESKVNEHVDQLGIIHRNARRLQNLINQLLDISRLETGQDKLQVSYSNLSGCARAIITSFQSHAESKNIRYEYGLPGSSQKVFFDGDKFEKIMTNLISNAFKFTGDNGKVLVNLKYIKAQGVETPESLEIVISDTGKGIPEDQIDWIFDRFYQVSDSDIREQEGTGIGLALTKELVDLCRGSIHVESEIGKGSTFTVRLPVAKESFKDDEIVAEYSGVERKHLKASIDSPEPRNADPDESHNVEADMSLPLILIVEDNLDLRNFISRNLGMSYRVVAAINGKEGLGMSFENIPDLVISDLMMPEMDGMEMCKRLKSDPRTSHIPLIMLTAKADKNSKLESYEKGADDYIIKPFDADELQSRVKNLIEQRKRLREWYRRELLTVSDPEDSYPEIKDEFLNKVLDIIESNLSNSEYSVEQLGQDVALSQSQLYRKIMALTDHSPIELIRNIRLKSAASMFRNGQKNVSTVLYAVGFNTPSNFSRYFRELYGMNPSDYIRKLGQIG